jgi:hypothetical protein
VKQQKMKSRNGQKPGLHLKLIGRSCPFREGEDPMEEEDLPPNHTLPITLHSEEDIVVEDVLETPLEEEVNRLNNQSLVLFPIGNSEESPMRDCVEVQSNLICNLNSPLINTAHNEQSILQQQELIRYWEL